jgi:hypothetical protein
VSTSQGNAEQIVCVAESRLVAALKPARIDGSALRRVVDRQRRRVAQNVAAG